jgi:hypothetical protein
VLARDEWPIPEEGSRPSPTFTFGGAPIADERVGSAADRDDDGNRHAALSR